MVCVVFSLVGLKRVLFTTIFTGFKEPPSFKVSSGQPDMYTDSGDVQSMAFTVLGFGLKGCAQGFRLVASVVEVLGCVV